MGIQNPSRLDVEDAADKFDFECDVDRCGFTSRGWHTAEAAEARGTEHHNEHETGEPMTELVEFEHSVGFVRPDTEG